MKSRRQRAMAAHTDAIMVIFAELDGLEERIQRLEEKVKP